MFLVEWSYNGGSDLFDTVCASQTELDVWLAMLALACANLVVVTQVGLA